MRKLTDTKETEYIAFAKASVANENSGFEMFHIYHRFQSLYVVSFLRQVEKVKLCHITQH